MRLKGLLSKLVSVEQSAFLPGRDIADNVLLTQELLQYLDKKVRGHNIVFKLDMAKGPKGLDHKGEERRNKGQAGAAESVMSKGWHGIGKHGREFVSEGARQCGSALAIPKGLRGRP